MKKLDQIRQAGTKSMAARWAYLRREHLTYLLRVAELAQRYDSGIPGHAIKDFISGEHEPYCAACALHAVLEEEA